MAEAERVALVGAGSIGVAWAVTFARAGHAVVLHDVDDGRLGAARRELETALAALHAHDLLAEPPGVVAARVATTGDLGAALAGAAYVQESGPEQLELKRALLAQLDAHAPPQATIASSTSAIAISQLAGGLAGRARFLVAHPANPPYLVPIVELVPAPFTAPAVVEHARRLLAGAGMSPVVVRQELEGFVLNRLQGALLREAYCLLRDGVLDVDDLDRVVRDGLGRRWALLGPFETADLNTRGGLARHAAIMGAAYARMGAERGQDDPWTPELVAEAVRQRRALLPLERWAERGAWRDRALMRLERARRGIEPFEGHDALTTPTSPVADADAERVAAEHYGIVATASRLAAERDDVFRLAAADGSAFVLKLAHHGEPPEVTSLATEAMLHVARVDPDVPVERIVPTGAGAAQVRVTLPDGATRTVRVTRFMPGRILRSVASSPGLRRNVGRALGRLDRALAGFEHPAAHRELQWDIQHAHGLRRLLDEIDAVRDRALLLDCLDRFDEVVRPRLPGLRTQAIHNDFASDNVLVDDAGAEIVGIVDFGDMAFSALVNDVAVAAAYQLSDGDDPLAGAIDVIAGYDEVLPLTAEERHLVGDVIRTRMALRVIIPEWRAARFPDNRDYVLRNIEPCWRQLRRIAGGPLDELEARLEVLSEDRGETADG
jgi:Ser/Thr protein kinase RdoA (MazF antagonist)/3-hydroxyacyl-CoA dehydrogenase